MLTKKNVLQTVNKLPDIFSIDQLIDRIILIDKIEEGLEDMKNNRVFSTEQVRQNLSKWLK